MQLPIVEPAPAVLEHSMAFRDLFDNRKQFQHFSELCDGPDGLGQ